ncbi:hypothetical protein LTR95_001122 [Oleoguttula sp. CCFEE 5521]
MQGSARLARYFHILDEVDEAVGTLGAIIAIILAGFTTQLRQLFAKGVANEQLDGKLMGKAADGALRNLTSYISAAVGGRTVMDTLLPFCESLEEDGDFARAVHSGNKGAKSTAGMKAKIGRLPFFCRYGTITFAK